MSKPSFRILEKDGALGYISAHRAEKFLSYGCATLVKKGVIRFLTEAASTPEPKWSHPWGDSVIDAPEGISDSRKSGFLRYPQPSQLSNGAKYPVLAKKGAGL